jgi:APA family basic amino acid/polyamine antiporter
MFFQQLFAKKSLETLQAEAAGENRLRRVLGPISLTSLGVGAIIGAGIFVMTGRAAAVDAGPAIVLSYVVAGIGCVFAAFCYAEFASMAPVAGSAYTYAYATLGELFAWIIGWDLILEYAMACAVVAAGWTHYLDSFLNVLFGIHIPVQIASDPFSTPGALFNLPAAFIILVCTVILVIGIRESATTNAILVGIKVGVVLFVIVLGIQYVNPANWTSIPPTERILPEEQLIPNLADAYVKKHEKLEGKALEQRIERLSAEALATYKIERTREILEQQEKKGEVAPEKARTLMEETRAKHAAKLPESDADRQAVNEVLKTVREEGPRNVTAKWGMLGLLGLNQWLLPIDDATRSPFSPFGLSGIIFGASIVFFAYIGFDAISTHSEEAKKPQRDVPIGILASLILCTILYIAVSAVITGMEPYPQIDQKAAVATAFQRRAVVDKSPFLNASAGLIATGALAGLTSVLLITFLSQARIFLAMARDRLLPPGIFGAIHPRFRTPHLSTMLTGGVITLVAAFTPIADLEEMVNIGTLMAFVIVCGAVLLLRIREPNAPRPFRTPFLFVTAPLGILVNLIMALFLPPLTWLRLVLWLAAGLCIYFCYGYTRSVVGRRLRGLEVMPGAPAEAEVKV